MFSKYLQWLLKENSSHGFKLNSFIRSLISSLFLSSLFSCDDQIWFIRRWFYFNHFKKLVGPNPAWDPPSCCMGCPIDIPSEKVEGMLPRPPMPTMPPPMPPDMSVTPPSEGYSRLRSRLACTELNSKGWERISFCYLFASRISHKFLRHFLLFSSKFSTSYFSLTISGMFWLSANLALAFSVSLL